MFDRTLHKAMRIILLERESYTATTQDPSVEIERRGLYMRKDGNAARAKQINPRRTAETRNGTRGRVGATTS
jgi:hypothetical protein